jgi:hypothetical protein
MDLVTAAGKAHLTYEEALETLGVTGREGADELKKIFREKMRKMHPDLPENRGVDTVQKALDLNAAYDILRGEARPAAYDFRQAPVKEPRPQEREPQRQPERTQWTPPKDTGNSWEWAVSKANLPAGVEWQFRTVTVREGYSSDEVTNSKNTYVVYGRVSNDINCFLVVVHYVQQDHFVGGVNSLDTWFMKCMNIPAQGDEGKDPVWLQKKVAAAFKVPQDEFVVGGRWNGKVMDVQGWTLNRKLPLGREMPIKNWLAANGQASAGAAESVKKGKQVVELEFTSHLSAAPGHYPDLSSASGDFWKFTLVLNGRPVEIGAADTAAILKARMGGKRLVNVIFGQYTYDSGRKVITRLRAGKAILLWMADHLGQVPDDVRQALTAAAAQMK